MAARRVSRLVVEIRREKNWFHFNDIRGSLVDLAGTHGFEKIKMSEGAFTVISGDSQHKIFMSTASVGIQVDAIQKIDEAENLLETLYKLLESNFLNKSFGNVRLGTKITTLFSPKTQDINKVKRLFRDKLMKNYIDVEDSLGVDIDDYAFESFDAKYNGRSLNFTLGPVTTEEAVGKFFHEKLYSEKFDAKTAYFAEFDLFITELKIKKISEIKENISKNMSYLGELQNNFEGVFSNGS
ncbi:hypothetical protein HYW35_04045 [Candidatus Saccharibacteria bacterium]|nr:hypothetical protein [Candidatus Saccharibacteria bacterium]